MYLLSPPCLKKSAFPLRKFDWCDSVHLLPYPCQGPFWPYGKGVEIWVGAILDHVGEIHSQSKLGLSESGYPLWPYHPKTSDLVWSWKQERVSLGSYWTGLPILLGFLSHQKSTLTSGHSWCPLLWIILKLIF